MSKSRKNVLVSSLAVLTAAVMLLGGGTYAYLQGETEDVVNTFNTNEVLVELDETTGSEYEIVPGMSSEKDPTVTVNATVPAYVYVEVTDATDGLVTYELADGWTALDGVENVYYREVEASDAEQTFAVLKDNTVSYDAALANSDMLNEDGTLKDGLTLTFKASAVQKEPFNDPLNAYYQSGTVTYVATADELETAVSTAAANGQSATIILTEDLALSETLTLSGDVTVIGNGHTISNLPVYVASTADVTLSGVNFDAPTNSTNNASSLYASSLSGKLVIDGCTFTEAQWDSIQITPVDGAEIVIQNCTFNNDTVTGHRYVHIQAGYKKNCDAKVTIINNTFGSAANVSNALIDVDYIDYENNLTVGGNTFADDKDTIVAGEEIFVCNSDYTSVMDYGTAYDLFTAAVAE